MWERNGSYSVLAGKPERRIPRGRHRRKWGIILKWICEKWDGGMDWIDLTQDSDKWQAVVNAVMNPPVS
jgi:hypothetical protein